MQKVFRVIDTGVREGRANIAFDQALIDLHQRRVIPDTIRFLQFRPSALVGRHQALAREVHLDFCRDHGIGLVRRITGGGALYMDEGQFGFELVFHRTTLGISSLNDLARTLCEAAAMGLQNLGVAARYRPRNDIEVEGRKISGTGGFFDGDTLFYQGTILVDMDPSRMLSVLNVPQAKLAKRALDSAEQRVVTLRELLGDRFPGVAAIKAAMLKGFASALAIAPVQGDISDAEEALAAQIFSDEIGTDDFVHELEDPAGQENVLSASLQGPGGTISAHLRLEDSRIREVLFTGDFFVTPPRIIFDLEASLRGTAVADVDAHVAQFFNEAKVGLLSARSSDFAAAVGQAAAKAATA